MREITPHRFTPYACFKGSLSHPPTVNVNGCLTFILFVNPCQAEFSSFFWLAYRRRNQTAFRRASAGMSSFASACRISRKSCKFDDITTPGLKCTLGGKPVLLVK